MQCSIIGNEDEVTVDEAASQEEEEEGEQPGVGEDGKEQPNQGELDPEQRDQNGTQVDEDR